MGLVATLLGGVLFGLALAAPPGPMNAVIAEESVARGWTAGVRAGLGAMTADLLFMLGAWLGLVGAVQRYPLVRGVMVAAGGLLMLYFARGALADLRTGFRGDGDGDAGGGRGFRKAFVLAATNPYQIAFWLTVGVGLLTPGTQDVLAGLVVVETGSPLLVVGVFSGIACWVAGFPAGLVAARRRVEALAPLVAGVSAAVLAAFGVLFLVDAAGYLLAALPPGI